MDDITKKMDYNSQRPHLLLAEYGRNVQNMVKHVITLPTKEERNKYAQAVIELMGHLNPHLRDVTDFKHKLWDHLFIISEFKLDVDSPYPIPSRETLVSKPQPIPYPKDNIRFKHYGKTIELMIDKIKTIEEPDKKEAAVNAIANFMKMSYVSFNKDTVADETILNDLRILSKGELKVTEGLNLNRVDVKIEKRPSNNFQRDKNRNSGSNKKRPGPKRF